MKLDFKIRKCSTSKHFITGGAMATGVSFTLPKKTGKGFGRETRVNKVKDDDKGR